MPTATLDGLCCRLPLRFAVTILSSLVALATVPTVAEDIIPLPGDEGLNSPGVTDVTDGEMLVLHSGPIASNTTINLFTGGELRADTSGSPWVVNLGSDNPPTSNIELNIFGGEFFISDHVYVYEGSTVNISGGSVEGYDPLIVRSGGTVNVSGGYVADLYSWHDANISITGGLVDLRFANHSGSLYSTSISGGALEPISFAPYRFYHRFDLAGGEWAVDGVPIGGLAALGDTSSLLLLSDSTLTGVLSDGTPIALSTQRGDYSSLNLQLELAEIPLAPSEVYASQSAGLTGARSGQTVIVESGASVGRGFRAASGSLTQLQVGGSLGEDSEFHNGVLEVAGGTVSRGGLVWGGGTLNLAAGTVDQLTLRGEATANISGGTATLASVEDPETDAAPTINITGGELIGNNLNGGVVNLSAGTLGGDAGFDQVINVSGSGVLLDGFRGTGSSEINVSGGQVGAVRVDGDLVASGGGLHRRCQCRQRRPAADWF